MCADRAAVVGGRGAGGSLRFVPTLAELDGDRDNNMDFMRFVAASMVIYAHAFNLAGRRDPLESVTGMPTGALAVAVFFALSGYLISRSLLNRHSLFEFLLARALRILPALIVANLLAVVVGALFWTEFSQRAYWSDPATWQFLVMNSTLLKNSYELPGVFLQNPFGPAVNGSLWTLPVEARMYGIVFAAGAFSLLLRGGRSRLALVTGFGVGAMVLSAGAWRALGLPVGGGLLGEPGIRLLGIFGFGMALQGFREWIRLDGRAVLIGGALCFLVRDTAVADAFFMLWLPYTCLWFAYTRKFNARGFGRHGDLSYGIYVYAFPIQQWIYSRNAEIDPLWNAAGTFAAVLVMAALSWRLVERPALDLKNGIRDGMSRFIPARSPG